jgi:hypothetical protein
MRPERPTSGLVALSMLTRDTGAAAGQSSGSVVGWGRQVFVARPELERLMAVASSARSEVGRGNCGLGIPWPSASTGGTGRVLPAAARCCGRIACGARACVAVGVGLSRNLPAGSR